LSHPKTKTARPADDNRPIFRFSYRSIPFRVHLRGRDANMGTAGILEAVVGVVPFTVDGDSRRRNTLAAIGEARRVAGYNIKIGADHAIRLSVPLPVDHGSPADAILAAAMTRLAGAKPFLDLVLMLQPPHLRRITETRARTAA